MSSLLHFLSFLFLHVIEIVSRKIFHETSSTYKSSFATDTEKVVYKNMQNKSCPYNEECGIYIEGFK